MISSKRPSTKHEKIGEHCPVVSHAHAPLSGELRGGGRIPSAARIPPGRLRNRRWLSNSGYVWLSILTAIFSKSGVSWGLALIWYFLLILVRDFYALVVKFGEIWGHFSLIFGRFWDPNRQFLMLVGKVGVQVGSSAKIERNWDPIPQKNLLLWGHFLKLFLIIFWKVLREGIFSHSGPQRLPKGGPRGHF